MRFRDPNADIPTGLATAEFVLRPIGPDDAARDHAAVIESRELLRAWEQSAWPEDDFSIEANRADVELLATRHRDRVAFAYTVIEPADSAGSECLGCVYLFPNDAPFLARSTISPLGGDTWADVDAAIYFWVRASRLASGLDRSLLDALRAWTAREWGLRSHVFVTNEHVEQQVAMIEAAGLVRRFDIDEPGKPGRFAAYA